MVSHDTFGAGQAAVFGRSNCLASNLITQLPPDKPVRSVAILIPVNFMTARVWGWVLPKGEAILPLNDSRYFFYSAFNCGSSSILHSMTSISGCSGAKPRCTARVL